MPIAPPTAPLAGQPPARSGTVTALAWVFIAASLATLLLAGAGIVRGEIPSSGLGDRGAGGLVAAATWLLERGRAVMGVLVAGGLLTFWLAVALLRRRSWARRAFLALMAFGFVATVGGAAITPLAFALLPDESAAAGVDTVMPLPGMVGLLAGLIVTATVLTALFAWVAWTLTRPRVHAEFEGSPTRRVR